MAKGRLLKIYRDGRRVDGSRQTIQLPTGAQANLITLAIMADMVRDDSQFPDLGNFIRRQIIGRDQEGSRTEQIETAYRFCRDQIEYLPEGEGTETIADLWSCMYGLDPNKPVGDCAIKSTALATCFAHLGLKPYFVAIRQLRNVDFFNHVFVGAEVDGKQIGYDPTPENFQPGEELPRYQTVNFQIFV